MGKKESTPILGILATILGIAVFIKLNFENLKSKNFGVGIVHFITFGASIYFIIKSEKD